MKAFWHKALILAGCVLALACARADERDEQVFRGWQIAVDVCGDCHAVGRNGESPLPIAPPFHRLARAYPLEWLEEALAEGMVTGHAEMPEVVLDPVQIEDFLAYLATIQD